MNHSDFFSHLPVLYSTLLYLNSPNSFNQETFYRWYHASTHYRISFPLYQRKRENLVGTLTSVDWPNCLPHPNKTVLYKPTHGRNNGNSKVFDISKGEGVWTHSCKVSCHFADRCDTSCPMRARVSLSLSTLQPKILWYALVWRKYWVKIKSSKNNCCNCWCNLLKDPFQTFQILLLLVNFPTNEPFSLCVSLSNCVSLSMCLCLCLPVFPSLCLSMIRAGGVVRLYISWVDPLDQQLAEGRHPRKMCLLGAMLPDPPFQRFVPLSQRMVVLDGEVSSFDILVWVFRSQGTPDTATPDVAWPIIAQLSSGWWNFTHRG